MPSTSIARVPLPRVTRPTWSSPIRRPSSILSTFRAKRHFSLSPPSSAQKLLWSGTVLDQTSDRLRPVALDWMEAVGIGREARSGISFTRISASPSHALLAFVTLESASSTSESESNQEQAPPSRPTLGYDVPFTRSVVAGRHSIISMGRNSYGELGLGFASQEATWGLVSSGFEGKGGVEIVKAGSGFGWILTKDERGRRNGLFANGNGTIGQTGDGKSSRQSNSGDPQMVLSSRPTKLDIGEEGEIEVVDVACGIDHSVVLVRKKDGTMDLLGCGLNTDYQLTSAASTPYQPTLVSLLPSFFPSSSSDAHPDSAKPQPSPSQPDLPIDIDFSKDPITSLSAGGDTTFLLTSSGRLFGWANNEYAQIGGRSDHHEERLKRPTEITNWVELGTGGRRAKEVVTGGSYVAILDDLGRVFTAGYGPLGLGKPLEATTTSSSFNSRLPILTSLLQVPLPRPVTGLSASLDHMVAWNADEARAWSWGLDSAKGRGSRLASDAQDDADAEAEAEGGNAATTESKRRLVWEPKEIDIPVRRNPAPSSSRDGGPASKDDDDLPAKILDVAAGADALWVLVEDAGNEDGLRGTWRGPGEFAEW